MVHSRRPCAHQRKTVSRLHYPTPSHLPPRHLASAFRLLLIASGAALSPLAHAQTAQPPVATPAAAAAAEKKPPAGVLTLNAFEVQADSDKSYGALNSASITRFNVEMDKLPVSADIFTEAFMKDIAATSVEDVVQGYSAGADFASGVDNGAASATANQPGDRTGNAYIQLRGMNTPQMQRDGFMPVGAFGNPGTPAAASPVWANPAASDHDVGENAGPFTERKQPAQRRLEPRCEGTAQCVLLANT